MRRILSRPRRDRVQGSSHSPKGRTELAELNDASHFHDRRFLLPICKASSLFAVRVHASEPLTVIVKQGHLPVMVFPPCIFPE